MPKRDAKYMQQKRAEILDAAVECLLRTGLSGFSTTQICEEAGISMGALYTHFKNKDEILAGLVERTSQERRSVLNVDTLDEFCDLILSVAKTLNTQQSIGKIRVDLELVCASTSDPKLAASMRDTVENADFENALKSLKRKGEIAEHANVRDIAAAIAAQFVGFSVYAATGGYYVKSRVAAMKILLESLKP